MKKSALLFAAILLSLGLYSQDDDLKSVLADQIGSYNGNDDLEIKVIDDGSTRGTRTYADGEKSMKIKLHRVPDTNLEKSKKEFGQLMEMFKELGEAGRMEVKEVSSEKVKGMAIFNPGRGSGGLILIVSDNYMFDVELFGCKGVEDAHAMFKSLDLSSL